MAVACPNCQAAKSKVTNTKEEGCRIRRCLTCGFTFHTLELLDQSRPVKPPRIKKAKVADLKPKMISKMVVAHDPPGAMAHVQVLPPAIVEIEIAQEVIDALVQPKNTKMKRINQARRIMDQKQIDKDLGDNEDPYA